MLDLPAWQREQSVGVGWRRSAAGQEHFILPGLELDAQRATTFPAKPHFLAG